MDPDRDRTFVPPDTYLCKVGEVRVGTTRNGAERWSMRLVVAAGEHVGRHAAWDALVFSERARPRLRQVLAAFGLPTDGTGVEPKDLEGKRAFVEVRAVEYATNDGTTVCRNEVPYSGYRAVTKADDALLAIHELMDGKEWSADTLQDIALVFRGAGFAIREPDEVGEENDDGP